MTNHETALILPTDTDIELLGEDVEAARGYAEKSLSEATRAAYRSDMGVFKVWCEVRGVSAVPASPEVVASFAASQAEQGLKPSTSRASAAARRTVTSWSTRASGSGRNQPEKCIRATVLPCSGCCRGSEGPSPGAC